MELTIQAEDLTKEQDPIVVPTPDTLETPQSFIQANTIEAQQRDQIFNQIQNVGQNRTTFDDQFNNQLNQLGTANAVEDLRETQLDLNELNTQFDVQNVQIAEGNSIGQGQREVTQNERERSVRSAGLQAQAAILQGNIQTAQSIARDTVNFAYQEEQSVLNQLGKQYDALQGRVEGQEAQLLQQRQNELDAKQAELDNLRDNVESAILSGVATPTEMNILTDPNRSQEERVALAQQISARGAASDRADTKARQWASINLAERKFQYEQHQDTLAAELEALQEQGLIDEASAENQLKVDQALQIQTLLDSMIEHPGFNLSVGSPGSRIISLTEGGLAGQAFNYLSGNAEGFDGIYDQVVESITVDQLNKMSGPKTDKDIEILRNAATRLRKGVKESEFIQIKEEMSAALQRVVDAYGVTPEQAKFYYGVDDNAMAEIDGIFDESTISTPSISF